MGRKTKIANEDRDRRTAMTASTCGICRSFVTTEMAEKIVSERASLPTPRAAPSIPSSPSRACAP